MSTHTRKIGDVAKVKGGKRLPKGMSVLDEATEHPYLRVVDFGDGGIDRSDIKYIDNETFDCIKRYTIDTSDVYISIAGTIGRVGVVPDDLSGANLTENAAKITEISDDVDHRYLMYYLRGPVGQGAIKNRTGGTSQPKLALYKIADIDFPYRPLVTQRRIASILSTYDNLIENNRRRIQLLEQSARLLYKEWFVHLRFPGHEHVKIKDGVPEGWEKKHLSELMNTQYGFTETATKEQVGPKFLRGTDINKTSYIDWSTVPYCSEEKLDFKKYALQPGDIVVIRMADPGKVAIVESKVRAIFASYLVRFKRKEDVSIPTLYLFYVLSDEKYQGFISGASGGSTRKSASAKLLVDFEALIPPDLLVSMFVEQIQPLRNQIQTLLNQNANLKQGRDLLLPKLMNGELTP